MTRRWSSKRTCPTSPTFKIPTAWRSPTWPWRSWNREVLVLDDGFQHRRLARDLDLVLLDALEPFGAGRLLPRGLLREPLRSLRGPASW